MMGGLGIDAQLRVTDFPGGGTIRPPVDTAAVSDATSMYIDEQLQSL
jgi:hypothetical protein